MADQTNQSDLQSTGASPLAPKSRKQIPEYLLELNDKQLEGALHFKGPILTLAGAGSGKTRVLTRRIAFLVEHYKVPPYAIFAVTFTNKAAQEMKERLKGLLGEKAERLWVSTFHSSCLRILRRHASELGYRTDFTVYDSDDSKSLIKQISKRLQIDESRYPPSFFMRAIESAKNRFISAEEFESRHGEYADSLIADVYQHYQRALLRAEAMDFGDLLFNCLKLFKEHEPILRKYQDQFQFVLVDEFQDTNEIQYAIIRALAAPQNNLFVVGDDDQSIYAFRGATIGNILSFERDYSDAKLVKLEQNYRSTQAILDSANAVIAKNPNRKGKVLWTEQGFGNAIVGYTAFDENDEAHFIAREIDRLSKSGIPYSSFAIFYRTNAQSRALEEGLMGYGIPYRIYGGLKFYDRKEVKDILAYMRLLSNPSDDRAFLRCVNTPPRGIGAKSIQNLTEAALEGSAPLLQTAERIAADNKAIGRFVSLMSGLSEKASTRPLFELVEAIIEESQYGEKLRKMNDVTAESRLENLKELQGLSLGFTSVGENPRDDLRLFLERAALASSEELPVEERRDEERSEPKPTVSLMTLHLAKGLEFPVVFLTGLEEGLIPHYKSVDDPQALSEERRLCYVGMTRAMERLYLSRANRRAMFARNGYGYSLGVREASRFVFDVPPQCFSEESRSFLEGESADLHYEFEDEISVEDVREARQERTRRPRKNPLANVVAADHLEPHADGFDKLLQAEVEQLSEGTAVVHRTFGPGTVQKISGTTPSDLKLTVKFEAFDLPKKLMFRHAKLALPSEE